MSMKRTRHIKKWFITIPRIAIREPGVYQIKLKISQVVIEKTKDLRGKVRIGGLLTPMKARWRKAGEHIHDRMCLEGWCPELKEVQ